MANRWAEMRRHWGLLVAGLVGILFGTPFVAYLLSPLARVFTQEFGWTLEDVIRLAPFQSMGMVLGLPIGGVLADRVRPRRLILTTMAVLAALVLCLPIAARQGYWYFGVLCALIGLLAAGLSGLYYTRVVGAVFDSARGFALGVTLSGAGLGAFVAPLFAHAMTVRFGWPAVYYGTGLVMILVAMPIVWFGLARAPHPRGPATRPVPAAGTSLAEAARDPRLYLMLTPALALGLVVSSLIVDIVPALLDRGVDAGTSARVASLYGVSTVLGRLGSGWLLDRFPAARVGFGVFSTATVGTLAFQADGVLGAVIATIAAGLVNGAEIDIMSYMTVRYFGLAHYGRIFGTSYAVCMGGAMIGPFIAASLMHRGGHALFFLAVSGLFAFSALVLLALARIEGEPFDPASQHRSGFAVTASAKPVATRATDVEATASGYRSFEHRRESVRDGS